MDQRYGQDMPSVINTTVPLDAKNKKGSTPLHIASGRFYSTEVQELLEKGRGVH